MKRLIPATLALAVIASLSVPAAAQDRVPRVAVVNMPRVFNELQETAALKAQLRADNQRLASEQKPMVDELQKMKAEGGNYRRGSQQYEEWRQRFMKADIAYQAWAQTNKQDLDWRTKRQTRELFEKINAAVAEYAQTNNIDLVLADHQPTLTDEEMEKVPVDQVGALLDRRRVIYASKAVDISDAIIASLDARYKAGGGAAPAVGIGQGQGNDADANTAGGNLRGSDQPQRRPGNR